MFNEYDIVRLRTPISPLNLSTDALGTILIIYNDPGLPRAYEIEFVDEDGNTLAITTLHDDDIEFVK